MKKILTIMMMVLFALSLIACQTESETIKVGVIGVNSGFASYYGQQQMNGLELALEELEAEGMDIELIYEDSEANVNKAIMAANKLVNIDEVDYIIGDSWVSTTAAIVQITNENEVILISPVAMLDSLSEDDYFFRTIPKTSVMMKELAEFAYENGSRRVGVIQQQTAYGEEHTQYFKEYFEELGGEVVIVEKIQLTQKDMKTELLKIKEADVDAIFNLHSSSSALGLVMKQAQELEIDVNWIASLGAENNPLIKEYSVEAEGLVYAFPYVENEEFAEKYYQKYNEQASFVAANSYDALKILVNAIGDGNVKQNLLSTKDYSGASGVLTFDQNGDVDKDILIKQISNGEFVIIE